MAKQGLFQISLARKCQLLFGLAVLLILAAALFVPGYFMETFVHDLNRREARRLAMLARARIDPSTTDWQKQQDLLNRWWEDHAKDLKLPDTKPTLVWLPPATISEINRPRRMKWLKLTETPLDKFLVRVGKCALSSETIRLTAGTWRRLPDGFRLRLANAVQILLSRVMQSGGTVYPILDEFQRQCVKEMRAAESLNEMNADRDPEHPIDYRLVLAVRGIQTGSARRPLVGIIDVQITAPKTKDQLFWTRI
ncbi:MAG: hypothetical protein JSV03_06480, partial [Planctomycetota bacterium]